MYGINTIHSKIDSLSATNQGEVFDTSLFEQLENLLNSELDKLNDNKYTDVKTKIKAELVHISEQIALKNKDKELFSLLKDHLVTLFKISMFLQMKQYMDTPADITLFVTEPHASILYDYIVSNIEHVINKSEPIILNTLPPSISTPVIEHIHIKSPNTLNSTKTILPIIYSFNNNLYLVKDDKDYFIIYKLESKEDKTIKLIKDDYLEGESHITINSSNVDYIN